MPPTNLVTPLIPFLIPLNTPFKNLEIDKNK